jgi:putative DNA primase/helicase
MTTHGLNDASDDRKQIIQWWEKERDANVAVACGATSGIFVIDLDAIDETNAYDGQETWRKLVAHYGGTDTRQQQTGGGGLQPFFAHPGAPARIGNRAQLLPGIDVRGDGGYVVVGPSIHPDTGKAYKWTNDIEPQQPPIWLLEILFDDVARLNALKVVMPDEAERLAWSKEYWSKSPELRAAKPAKTVDGPAVSADSDEMKRWLTVTMDKAYQAVASAPKGGRNAALNRETYSLAGLIPHIDRGEIERLMFMAAEKSGYVADDGEAEVNAAIKSAIDSGSKSPRQLPELTPTRPSVVVPEMEAGDADYVPSDEKQGGAQHTKQDIAKLLREAIRNDAGNADCLQAMYGRGMRYCHTRDAWLIWDGARWALDRTGAAQRLARKVAQARSKAAADIQIDTKEDAADKQKLFAFAIASEASTVVERTLKSASTLKKLATTIDKYDTDPFLANAGNVTIDLKTCKARENRQGDYITKKLGAKYNPQAQCPRWLQFLNEVFNSDKELIAYMQRVIGYALTGDISEQKLFLCHGGGSNGKSLFLGTLAALMGEYGGSTPFETFDAESAEARQDLAKLAGTRFVTVVETDEDRRLAEARVKALTGDDVVTARELYAKSFDYTPTYKIFIAMNHKPTIRGIDRGIWRRVKLIPFTQSFEGREEKGLKAKLLSELPGILNWALEGLKAWHIQGVGKCRAVDDATEEYRQESDVVEQWLSDRTVKGETMVMEAAAAYEDFARWRGNVTRFENKNWFGRRMTEKGHKSEKQSGQRFYRGLGLLSTDKDK